MDYKCGVCGHVVKENLKALISHTEKHIVDIIQKKHPGWVEENGVCRKCLEYYRAQMRGKSLQ